MNRSRFSFVSLLLLLLLALLSLWLFGERHWQAPQAQRPELGVVKGEQLFASRVGLDQLPETVERPLFAPDRRPPAEGDSAAPAPAAPPAQADQLDQAVVLGVFGSGDAQRVMLRVDGKVLRLGADEQLGEWRVRAFGEQTVIFMRGSERRELELKHAAAPPPPPASQLVQRLRERARALGAAAASEKDAAEAEGESGDEE